MNQADEIDSAAREKLAELETRNIRRRLNSTHRTEGGMAHRDRRDLISFCDNDYLGLSTDPRVIEAACKAAKAYGAGAGASRLVTGDCPLNAHLEQKLATMKATDAARVFGSGYLANIGTVPVLVGKDDLIVMDELAHACLHTGAKLSGADIALFRHNDPADADRALNARAAYRRALIVTETVFSMDGDVAPLADLDHLCREYDAWMMTDDAHGLGVVALDNPAPIQMGTLSKAAGAYGGYVCGPDSYIDLLTGRARSLIYTTGLPPSVLGAALKALEIINAEPQLGDAALTNAALFANLLDLPTPQSAIIPIILGDAGEALTVSETLSDKGFLVSAIRPPTVPEGTARLRCTFTAVHQEKDVRALAAAIKEARK